MTAAKLAPVRCVCGWRGTLALRTPCSSCKRQPNCRVTPERLAVLVAIGAGRDPAIVPIQRIWFKRYDLITETAKPSRSGRTLYRLTALGETAIAEVLP